MCMLLKWYKVVLQVRMHKVQVLTAWNWAWVLFSRQCTIQHFSSHTIIINFMGQHLQQSPHHIIMLIHPEEHLLHHRRNVSQDPLIFTILLLRWTQQHSPAILHHLCYSPQGIIFLLPLPRVSFFILIYYDTFFL